MQKEKIYHIYSENDVLAHNLTFDELCVKIKNKEFDLDEVEVLQLSLPTYTEDSY